MTTSTQTSLDFQHEPGLFAFLQYQCTLSDAPALGYHIHKAEQPFLEAIEFDLEARACVRKAARQTGGTTLFCAMAWHYHLMGYQVAVSTSNHSMLNIMRRVLEGVEVLGFKPIPNGSSDRIHLSTIGGMHRPPHPIRLIVTGRDYYDAFKGQTYDFIFIDNVSPGNQASATRAGMKHITQKVVLNVTP